MNTRQPAATTTTSPASCNKYKHLLTITNFLRSHADNVCQKVDEKLRNLDNSFDRLASDLCALQDWIREDRHDIDEMKQNQGYLHERRNKIERELEELQKDTGQCTLKWCHTTTNTPRKLPQIIVDLQH
ncbi:hypothetical protein ACOMHN_062177 [Nucella lapillus]